MGRRQPVDGTADADDVRPAPHGEPRQREPRAHAHRVPAERRPAGSRPVRTGRRSRVDPGGLRSLGHDHPARVRPRAGPRSRAVARRQGAQPPEDRRRVGTEAPRRVRGRAGGARDRGPHQRPRRIRLVGAGSGRPASPREPGRRDLRGDAHVAVGAGRRAGEGRRGHPAPGMDAAQAQGARAGAPLRGRAVRLGRHVARPAVPAGLAGRRRVRLLGLRVVGDEAPLLHRLEPHVDGRSQDPGPLRHSTWPRSFRSRSASTAAT